MGCCCNGVLRYLFYYRYPSFCSDEIRASPTAGLNQTIFIIYQETICLYRQVVFFVSRGGDTGNLTQF